MPVSCWTYLSLSSWRRREKRRDGNACRLGKSSRQSRNACPFDRRKIFSSLGSGRGSKRGFDPFRCALREAYPNRAVSSVTVRNLIYTERSGEMEYQTIIYEVRNQIAFVTFNRPEAMNAMNRQMTRDLIEACRQIEEDAEIRIAIFTGAGERRFPPAWI